MRRCRCRASGTSTPSDRADRWRSRGVPTVVGPAGSTHRRAVDAFEAGRERTLLEPGRCRRAEDDRGRGGDVCVDAAGRGHADALPRRRRGLAGRRVEDVVRFAAVGAPAPNGRARRREAALGDCDDGPGPSRGVSWSAAMRTGQPVDGGVLQPRCRRRVKRARPRSSGERSARPSGRRTMPWPSRRDRARRRPAPAACAARCRAARRAAENRAGVGS